MTESLNIFTTYEEFKQELLTQATKFEAAGSGK